MVGTRLNPKRRSRSDSHPDPHVRRLEQNLITTPASVVDNLARAHPDDHIVQRLLLQHPHTDLDLVAEYLERLATQADASTAKQAVNSDIFFRLAEIITHDRARRALISLVVRLDDPVAIVQLLGLLTEPSETAFLIAALARRDPTRARKEIDLRWPDMLPADVCATLLSSASDEFRLWLISRTSRIQQSRPRQGTASRTKGGRT